MFRQEEFSIDCGGRGTTDITDRVQAIVGESGLKAGLCHVFIHHTSASLMICENYDVQVRKDMETFMSRLAPDGDPMFVHDDEGPDDMPAHVRTILTDSGLTLPIADGRCKLGTYQGVYLWEHRTGAHRRRVTVTLNGE